MQKHKEAEVRHTLLKILPDHYQMDGNTRIKLRIFEIDTLTDYITSIYNMGYTDGKKRTQTMVKKLIYKL